jgi:hypothetical protein
MKLDDAWLLQTLKKKGLHPRGIFFLGIDDAQNLYWIEKEKK